MIKGWSYNDGMIVMSLYGYKVPDTHIVGCEIDDYDNIVKI